MPGIESLDGVFRESVRLRHIGGKGVALGTEHPVASQRGVQPGAAHLIRQDRRAPVSSRIGSFSDLGQALRFGGEGRVEGLGRMKVGASDRPEVVRGLANLGKPGM